VLKTVEHAKRTASKYINVPHRKTHFGSREKGCTRPRRPALTAPAYAPVLHGQDEGTGGQPSLTIIIDQGRLIITPVYESRRDF